MRISVIVPAFNAASTIAETIASILAQSLLPNEVLVVDDGSVDDTAAIAEACGSVRVRTQQNLGTAAAMNLGVSQTSGDAVAFLDADDLWSFDALATQSALLHAQGDADAVVGQVEEFIHPDPSHGPTNLLLRPAQTGWLSGATLLRREALTIVGPFDTSLRLGAWIDWVDRARRSGISFALSDHVVLRRRLRHGTLSASGRRNSDFLNLAHKAILRRRERDK